MEMDTGKDQIRTTQIMGYKALEIWEGQQKPGELNICVADRFWVRLEGEGLDNLEVLKAAARQMDLKKLAGLPQ